MLFHVLALLDIVCVILLVFGHYGLMRLPLLYAALYLVSKLLFYRDILTIIDAALALYFLYVFFAGHGTALTWLIAIYFAYKSMVWMFYSFAS